MNKVDLYLKSNELQSSNVKEVLQKFTNLLKWRSDGCDSILDVGCGPGDVTWNILLPILPANFERLVCVDISKEMISYARKAYAHPKIAFEQFNLEMELEKQSLNGIEPFDHVTSFFCLMMIQDQKTCIQNLYKLLKPGGDMLLVLHAGHALYDIYQNLSECNLWDQYMTDVDQKTSPYHYLEDPAEAFRHLLRDCGFKDWIVELHNKEHIFQTAQHLKDFVHSTTRYIDRIPDDGKEAFLDDIVHRFVEYGYALDDFSKRPTTCRIKLPYRLLVAYARK